MFSGGNQIKNKIEKKKCRTNDHLLLSADLKVDIPVAAGSNARMKLIEVANGFLHNWDSDLLSGIIADCEFWMSRDQYE